MKIVWLGVHSTRLPSGNRSAAVVMVFLFTLGMLVPVIVVGVTPSHLVTMGGTPIQDSVFNEIATQVQDEAMLPGGAAGPTLDGIRLPIDYSGLERVDESVAAETMLQFAAQSSYLTDQNLTRVVVWTWDNPTCWPLRFFGPNVTVYGAVNAFSGKVIDFQIAWDYSHGSSPYWREYNGTDPMSKAEVEAHALEFLKNNNYTLDGHSRYLGPLVERGIQYVSQYVYTLRFFDIINEVLVWGNVIELNLDIDTGEVVDFQYHWVFVSSISILGSMSSGWAETIAFNHLRALNEPVASLESSVLLVMEDASGVSNDYRLIWVVSVDSDNVGEVYLDAVTGEVLSVSYYMLASPILESSPQRTLAPPWFLIPVVFLPSAVTGLAAFRLVRRRVWKGLPESDAEPSPSESP